MVLHQDITHGTSLKRYSEAMGKFLKAHGDKYDYSNAVYIRGTDKIEIICPTHGSFWQTPNSHLHGQGCQQCNLQNRTKTQTEYIDLVKEIHNDKYDYSRVVYTKGNNPIAIICKEHGEFTQRASSHLEGYGCPKCAASNRTSTTENFIALARQVHGDLYNYDKVNYITSEHKVTITCKIHGDFEQAPGNHTQGSLCPKCAGYGYKTTLPGYLYYLKVTTDEGKVLYKIGITNRSVEARFNLTELSKIEIVKLKLFEDGLDALTWETKILKRYKRFQYKGPDILESGNTELFTEDVMALYYKGY